MLAELSGGTLVKLACPYACLHFCRGGYGKPQVQDVLLVQLLIS